MTTNNHSIPIITPNLLRFPGDWIGHGVRSEVLTLNSKSTDEAINNKLVRVFGQRYNQFLRSLEATARPNVTALAKIGSLKMFHEHMNVYDLFNAMIEDLIRHYKTQYPEDTAIDQEWKDVLIAYAEYRYQTQKDDSSPFSVFATKLLERLKIVEKESDDYEKTFKTVEHLKLLLEEPNISDLLLCVLHHPEAHVENAKELILVDKDRDCKIPLSYSSVVQALQIEVARFQNDLNLIGSHVVAELTKAKEKLSVGIKKWEIALAIQVISDGTYTPISKIEADTKKKQEQLLELVAALNQLDFANLDEVQTILSNLEEGIPRFTDKQFADYTQAQHKNRKKQTLYLATLVDGSELHVTHQEFSDFIKAARTTLKCHKLWDLFVIARIININRLITVINTHHTGIRTLFNNNKEAFRSYLETPQPFQLSYPDLAPPVRTTTITPPPPPTPSPPAPPISADFSTTVEQITSGIEDVLRKPAAINSAGIALRQTCWHLDQLNGFLKSDTHRSDHLYLWIVASHCAWAIEQALSYKLLSQGKPVPPGHNLRLRYDSYKPGERYFPDIIDQLYLFNHWSRFPLEGYAEYNAKSIILSRPRLPKLLLKMVQYADGKDTKSPDLNDMITNTCTLLQEVLGLSPKEVRKKSIVSPISIDKIEHAQVTQIIQQLNTTITTLPPDTRRADKLKQARSSLRLLNEVLGNFNSATTPQQLNSSVVCTLNLLQHAISEILSYHLLSNGHVLEDKHEISVFADQLGINTGDVGKIFHKFSQKGRYPVSCAANGEAAKLVDECEVLCKSPPIEDGFTPVSSKVDSFGWKLQNAGTTPEKIRERLEIFVSKSCQFLNQSLKK